MSKLPKPQVLILIFLNENLFRTFYSFGLTTLTVTKPVHHNRLVYSQLHTPKKHNLWKCTRCIDLRQLQHFEKAERTIANTGVCTYHTDINMRRWRTCPDSLRSENRWGLSAEKWTEMRCQAQNEKSTWFNYCASEICAQREVGIPR